jgi:hypothetical protein
MSYWVLPYSGIPVSVTTVQRLSHAERDTNEMRDRMNQYDNKLRSLLFDLQAATVSQGLRDVDSSKIIDPDDEDPGFFDEFSRIIDDAGLQHADDDVSDREVSSDNYVGMELAFVRGGEGEAMHATVRRRMTDKKGNPVGIASSNPLLDSRKYEV